MPETLYKYPSEIRTFSFDYSQFTEIINGDTIVSIISLAATPDDDNLTLGTQAVVGSSVTVILSGGAEKTHYTVDCLVSTASGARLMGQGFLFIEPE